MYKIFLDGKQIGALVQEFPEEFPEDWTLAGVQSIGCDLVDTLENCKKYLLKVHPMAEIFPIKDKKLWPAENCPGRCKYCGVDFENWIYRYRELRWKDRIRRIWEIIKFRPIYWCDRCGRYKHHTLIETFL